MPAPVSALIFALGMLASLRGAVVVHLKNGADIEAQSQSSDGEFIRLAVNKGTIELAAIDVDHIDTLPEIPSKQSEELSVAQLLLRASETAALPSSFVETVARAESGFRTDAVSPKGAVGLMQLMPATASRLGVNQKVPGENAMGGALYLRELLLRYHNDAKLALAAYNAGPAAVERYHGVPPYPETIAYINRVLREYQKLQKKAAGN